jgi:ABC-type multidrug transport system fused ATPase/permease subunit
MTSPYVSLLRTAWRCAREARGRFVAIYALFILANLAFAIYPLLYGWFIDAIQRDGARAGEAALWYGGAYVAVKLIEWGFHGPARILERKLAFDLSRNFLEERYHQALHLPVKWHQDHHSGSTINRIRKAYEALRQFFDGGFMYIHALAKLVFSIGAMIWFSPLYGGIGAVLGAFTVAVIFVFDKPLIRTMEQVNEREHTVSATLFDSLSNILTVITQRLENSMQTGLMAKVAEILPPFRRNALINEWKWFVADMLVGITYATITIGYVFQNWKPAEAFAVGGLVTLLGYVNQFTSVFHDIAWQYNTIVRLNTEVETAGSIRDAYALEHRPDEPPPLPASWRAIEIRGLNFTHRDTYEAGHAPQSLHDISLTLRRGARIALVGESGCGKSTLLALLRGLYQPRPGFTVRIDGRAAELASVDESTTLFPQEPEIFENTIAYNITLGLPFGQPDIDQVCRTAAFDDVVTELPKGFESNIQERGVNLSGGQKQRLALARGVLAARQSDIVPLDEPTSSVDPKTEAGIYWEMSDSFRDKVMVSAMHRLHLLRQFDEIYVLGQGRILDHGTCDELLGRCGAFQALWRSAETAAVA